MLRKNMKLAMTLGALVIGAAAIQSAGAATIVNGGFEAFPDFTGFQTIGNTSVQGADFKTPTEGAVQAFLLNGTAADPGATGATTNIPALDAFFNLSPGSLEASNIKSGSGVKQTFTGTAGETISFNYDFATNEGPRADFAFYTLTLPGSGTNATPLANPGTPSLMPTNPLDGLNSYLLRETGYKSLSFTLPTTGVYTLGFGVVNAIDTTVSSGLLVDNITSSAGSAVPLPAGMYFLPLGLAVAALYSAKMRRTAAC
jgi:hypothetical protein